MAEEVKKSETNKIGIAALIASIGIPLAQLMVGYIQNNTTQNQNTILEKERRRLEITKLFLDNYVDKKSDVQIATIQIMKALDPTFFITIDGYDEDMDDLDEGFQKVQSFILQQLQQFLPYLCPMNNHTKILSKLGIEALNPMQEEAQKAILAHPTTFLLSPTGSGKTLAFLLPLLELMSSEVDAVQCLILTPSRELAMQIEQVWKSMGTGLKVNVSYGGHDIATEIRNFSNPPALLVGTPGRICDHISRKSFTLDGIKTLILDEFDKSLDLGFHEEMSFIISSIPNLTKRILVSATYGIKIPEFVGFTSPITLNYILENEAKTALQMRVVISEEKDKINTLFDLICSLNNESALIFCNHRDAVERTSELLNEMGVVTAFYHGGMDQDDRERALILFRNGSVNYLVTTDLAARGLDIPEMKHVIHYHLPLQEHEFTHRNGRTARMNASGTAYLIFHESEHRPKYLDNRIEELKVSSNNPLPNPPEFVTIYVSGGKKNKLNKVDIVGFFSKKGELERSDLGLIEVKDFTSFAAVKRTVYQTLLSKIKEEKLKGKKYKIEVAR